MLQNLWSKPGLHQQLHTRLSHIQVQSQLHELCLIHIVIKQLGLFLMVLGTNQILLSLLCRHSLALSHNLSRSPTSIGLANNLVPRVSLPPSLRVRGRETLGTRLLSQIGGQASLPLHLNNPLIQSTLQTCMYQAIHFWGVPLSFSVSKLFTQGGRYTRSSLF